MVKQLKKRADHDDNVGAAVALATRVPTSIDKRAATSKLSQMNVAGARPNGNGALKEAE